MLDILIGALRPGLEVAAVIWAVVSLSPRLVPVDENAVTHGRGLWLAALAGLVAGSVAAYLLGVGVLEQDAFGGVSSSAASLAILVWAAGGVMGRLRRAGGSGPGALAMVTVFAMVLPRAWDLWLVGAKAAVSSEIVTSELLARFAGLALGGAVAALALTLLLRAERVSTRGASVFAAIVLVVLLAEQLVRVAQAGFAYGVLPLSPVLVGVLAPFLNGDRSLSYVLIAAVAAPFTWRAILNASDESENESTNPAEARLRAARRRNRRRLSTSAAATVLTGALAMAGQSVALSWEGSASRLSAAKAVTVRDAHVRIPSREVADGKLHRFAAAVGDDTNVRFIVIHKGSGVFGVALDACQICGTTGYFQRDKDVVCKACGVAINVPTIGLAGGCNPIPLTHRMDQGDIVIDARDLSAAKRRFR